MSLSIKGRGALSNPVGRFAVTHAERIDDGWYTEETPPSIATHVEPEHARSIISSNDSPDIGFDASINPYRGCEHGCVYCYARPSHAYVGLSPGLDFERRLFYKVGAAALLRRELARPGYVCKLIALGANTDPYQPIERQLGVTRAVLDVLRSCRHPVTIVTKGALVLRDLGLLADLARDGLASVMVSITSLNVETKRTLEPRAASPQARLRIIEALAAAGIPVGVFVAPVIPAITDHELEDIVTAAANAGAGSANYVLLRLPYEVKTLFTEWLEEHHPLRARHVMSVIASMRDGRANDPRFGSRMRGTGPFAELLRARFRLACQRAGIATERPALNTLLFAPPRADTGQLDLDI
jgi:DNA repair photolyase